MGRRPSTEGSTCSRAAPTHVGAWRSALGSIRWFIGLNPTDTIQKCAEHDIVVEAYSPFALGLIIHYPEIADIAARYGVSAPQLCIRYLLQNGAVVLPNATKTRTFSKTPTSTSASSPPRTWASSTPCATPTSTRTQWSSAGPDQSLRLITIGVCQRSGQLTVSLRRLLCMAGRSPPASGRSMRCTAIHRRCRRGTQGADG
jgi:hypothetical protein